MMVTRQIVGEVADRRWNQLLRPQVIENVWRLINDADTPTFFALCEHDRDRFASIMEAKHHCGIHAAKIAFDAYKLGLTLPAE